MEREWPLDGGATRTWLIQIGRQVSASGRKSGRNRDTATVVDDRGGTLTTFTSSGTATIVNEENAPTFSAPGEGLTVSGLEKIIPASCGMILDEGDDAGLWFSGSFGGGGSYSSPAGDFSTPVLNSNDLVDSHVLHARPARLRLNSTAHISNRPLESLIVPFIPAIVREFQAHSFLELSRAGIVVRRSARWQSARQDARRWCSSTWSRISSTPP